MCFQAFIVCRHSSDLSGKMGEKVKTIIDGIEVTIERRKVKNVNLYVQPPDGHILITAPSGVSEKKIREFVLSRRGWILRAQERVRTGSSKTTDEPEIISEDDIERLKGWIEKYAAKWEPVLGVKCTGWTIRAMKTRWGSCSVQKGTIRINARLAVRAEDLAEMVIVHELVHLRIPGHGRDFYASLESCIPDWRERQKRLK